jgi:hypothetical protein
MPAPMPWSYTSLTDFKNCPRAFYEKRVIKSVKEESTEALVWGNQIHKAFELFVGHGTPLPDMLAEHQPFLDKLRQAPGVAKAEEKVALNKRAEPCGFFDRDVWWRGVLDYHRIHNRTADVVDYKTGKRKPDWVQLYIFAIWVFAKHPDVTTIDLHLYWTQDKQADTKLVTRPMIPELWSHMTGDLRQYRQAFHDDVWREKPSGLCNGWCPVRHCEHWKPKRSY